MKKSGIYSITNVINKKIYIGSSSNIDGRWLKHRSDLRLNKHNSSYLQHSWNKYGEQAFKFKFLEETNNLILQEQYYMDKFKSYNKNFGYNICPKARTCAGRSLSEMHKKRIGLANKGTKYFGKDNPFFDKHHSEKTKQILREKSKNNKNACGYIPTKKARNLISLKNKGRIPWNKGLRGQQIAWNKGKILGSHTKNHNLKISKALKIYRSKSRKVKRLR